MEMWKGLGAMLGMLLLTVGGSHVMTSQKIEDQGAATQQKISVERRAEWAERHRQDSLRDVIIIAKLDTLIHYRKGR